MHLRSETRRYAGVLDGSADELEDEAERAGRGMPPAWARAIARPSPPGVPGMTGLRAPGLQGARLPCRVRAVVAGAVVIRALFVEACLGGALLVLLLLLRPLQLRPRSAVRTARASRPRGSRRRVSDPSPGPMCESRQTRNGGKPGRRIGRGRGLSLSLSLSHSLFLSLQILILISRGDDSDLLHGIGLCFHASLMNALPVTTRHITSYSSDR